MTINSPESLDGTSTVPDTPPRDGDRTPAKVRILQGHLPRAEIAQTNRQIRFVGPIVEGGEMA